jgi:hypothetical protein
MNTLKKEIIMFTLILVLFYQGCISEKSINKISEIQASACASALSYRAACDKWPKSVKDLVKLSSNCSEIPLDPNLVEEEKLLRFEELPDGKLKITYSKFSWKTFLTIDVSKDINAPHCLDSARCCGE